MGEDRRVQSAAEQPLASMVVESTVESRKNRKYLHILAASLLLDLILSVGLGWVAYRNRETANDLKSTITTNCVAGNQFRSLETSLWTYVLTFPPDHKLTQTEVDQRKQFSNFIHKTFAPRKCVVK